MKTRKYNHIYGPVPSRRLGRSLGVDLAPFKVCPLDCTYCQVGRTTVHTDRRAAYIDAERIVTELLSSGQIVRRREDDRTYYQTRDDD